MAYSHTDKLVNDAIHDFRDKDRSAMLYIKYMLSRSNQIFNYDGLPDTLNKRVLELYMQTHGFVCIAEYNDNLYAFFGGLGGKPNVYYLPTEIHIANPALEMSKTYTIDKDCVIIPNDTLYMGLLPMFRRYATAISENDLTMLINDINMRIPFISTTESDRVRNAAELFFRDVEKGKLGVVAGNEVTGSLSTQPYSNTANARFTDLIEYQQYLKGSWWQDLGLQSNFNMKREAINGDEADLNVSELFPFIDDMLEQRQIGVDKVNKMFGTSISVSLNSAWANERKKADESDDADDDVNDNAGDVKGDDNV